jgi:hypothetical protein
MRALMAIVSIAMIPMLPLLGFRAVFLLMAARKGTYGWSPIPIPWMKTMGSWSVAVWGRYQYESLSAGDLWGVSSVNQRNGKLERD